jgi:hypothetical protein
VAVVWVAADGPVVGPLGAQLQRLAGRRGCAARWRFFAGGVLGVPVAVVDVLAAEPVPTTPEECAAAAARHGVDDWILQRVLELACGQPAA